MTYSSVPILMIFSGAVLLLFTFARQGFFLQFWEGALGPFRLGKLAW